MQGVCSACDLGIGNRRAGRRSLHDDVLAPSGEQTRLLAAVRGGPDLLDR